MAKPELGTKRVCPETGRKFYDLNKDPVVSPYTGISYPLSSFQDSVSSVKEIDEEELEDKELDEDSETEMVSLEEADDDDSTGSAKGPADDSADLGDDDDIDLGDEDDDPFLADEDEDEEDDDVTGIIGGVGGDDDEV